MTRTQVEVITSVQRRRSWSRAEKERIVAAAMEPGAVASEVARAAGIHTSQLFRWRQQLCERTQVPAVTQALEDLAVELYARGLSTRDIEDAFTDESGRRLLSRAAVSEITERLWAEYEAFIKRDLSEYRIVYLYVDGIAERLRAGQPREAVIAAWGIGEDGRKVLLHLMAGSKEDTETVRAFFQDMRARGLGDPLLVVSEGAPGVIRAIEECFPRSARQRFLAHRMRNLALFLPPLRRPHRGSPGHG